ncbi:RDD family protein [Arthrobacter sp.]|uniref:RDD family protein n=1 Tax=Arthrobacter sp. TaxID=1667 RepID=UPI0026E10D37|nr:RDD family protein [Arthrobacter sp.]MDO5753334.1 RDD family protein [Arthrobacter sp.]
MAQKVADPCRNCGAVLAHGAAFCTLCGTTVTNRAATPAGASVPLGSPAPLGGPDGSAAGSPAGSAVGTPAGFAGGGADGHAHQPFATSLPGIVPVGTSSNHPLVAPRQMGVDPRIAAATALVPGGAGRRLAAKLIDGILPAILVGVAAGIGASLIKVTQAGSYAQVDLTWLMILLSIASVLSLGYGIWLWLWEAKSGKTPGNLMLGLRTTNMEGHPAGVLAIFLRLLIIGVSSIVPTIGPLLVIISNTWDSNAKKQGWHDKVAHTLVFNVKTGRDPLETGGIAERANFVPAEVPTISEVRSPLARPTPSSPTPSSKVQGSPVQNGPVQESADFAAPAPPPARRRGRKKQNAADPFAPPAVQFHGQQNQQFPLNQPQQQNQPIQQPRPEQTLQPGQAFEGQPRQTLRPGQTFPTQPLQENNPFAPPSTPQSEIPVDQGPITAVPGSSRPAQAAPAAPVQQLQHVQPTSNAADDDDAAGETRIRAVNVPLALRLTFDDGRSEDISTVALIGRNPAGYDGEMISRLIRVHDSSRSVSKTHLHVRISTEGLWVTDRNSTNGSSLSSASGGNTPLVGGTPMLAEIGSRVHFGDRSFVVDHA